MTSSETGGPKRGQTRYKGILNWHRSVWSAAHADVERKQYEDHLLQVDLIFLVNEKSGCVLVGATRGSV